MYSECTISTSVFIKYSALHLLPPALAPRAGVLAAGAALSLRPHCTVPDAATARPRVSVRGGWGAAVVRETHTTHSARPRLLPYPPYPPTGISNLPTSSLPTSLAVSSIATSCCMPPVSGIARECTESIAFTVSITSSSTTSSSSSRSGLSVHSSITTQFRLCSGSGSGSGNFTPFSCTPTYTVARLVFGISEITSGRIREIERGPSRFQESFSSPASWKRVSGQDALLREKRQQLVQQRIQAYREDLAEWFSKLFDENIPDNSFLSSIDDGILLCRLAKIIEAKGSSFTATRGFAVGHDHGSMSRNTALRYNNKARRGTFHARDNVSTFISWARGLGIDKAVLFETSDLVERKNEKNVLYSLMEIARVQDAVDPPSLIRLERSIDRDGSATIDENALENAICQICSGIPTDRSRVFRLSPGLYEVDGKEYFIALIREQVLVRNGKHWDPLEHLLLNPPDAASRGGSRLPSSSQDTFSAAAAARRSSRTGYKTSQTSMSPEKYGGRHGSVTSKESLPPPVLKESLYGANIQKTDELNRRIEALEREVAETKAALEKEQHAHSSTKNRLDDLLGRFIQLPSTDDFEALQEQNRELTEANNFSTQRMQDCIEYMERMRQDHIASMQEKNRDLDEQHRIVDDLKTHIQRLEDQQQTQNLQDKERAEDELASARQAVQQCEERNSELSHLYQDSVRQNENILAELHDAHERICQLEKILSETRADADNHLQERENSLEKLRLEIAGREEEVAGLQDELESIRLQLAHSKSQLQQTEDKSKTDVQHLNDKLEEVQNKLQHVVMTRNELQTSLNSAENENERLLAELERTRADATRNSTDIQAALNDCCEERKELTNKVKELEDKLNSQSYECAALMSDLGEAQDALSSEHASLEELQQELEESKADVEGLLREKQELEDSLILKQEKLDSLDTASFDLQQQLEELQIRYDQMQKDMSEAKAKCDEDKQQLRNARDRAIDDVVVLEEANNQLLTNLRAMEKRFANVEDRQAKHENELRDMSALAQNASEVIAALRDSERRAKEEAAAAREQYDLVRAEIEAREDEERQAREAEEIARLQREKEEEEKRRQQEEEDRKAQEEHERMMILLAADEQLQQMNRELQPIKDDLADWFNELLGSSLTEQSFFHDLQSGIFLCQLANIIDEHEEETRMFELEAASKEKTKPTTRRGAVSRPITTSRPTSKVSSPAKPQMMSHTNKQLPPGHPLSITRLSAPAAFERIRRKRRRVNPNPYNPRAGSPADVESITHRNIEYCPFDQKAKAGTAKARQNVCNFIKWAQGLGLVHPDAFSPDDLLQLKDARRVISALYDIARRTRQLRVPRLVWLERLKHLQQPKVVKGDRLDEAVKRTVAKCINQPRILVKRIGDGKYTFGEDMTKPLLMRMTDKNVLVRVGGGWQTLSKYLDTHFPADPKMKADKERFEELWKEDSANPQECNAHDGTTLPLHTTRKEDSNIMH
eukprot:gene9166-1457_t